MKVNTYLNFPGNCAEALAFYEQNLGAKVVMKGTFAETMAQGVELKLPPDFKPDNIIHARFMLGDTMMMASDGPPERTQPMRSSYVCLSVNTDEEAERIYKALSEGGEVFMAMAETFFAHRFGQFRDKFGINWMVIHERPMGSH